jgi:hypothetical protein
LGVVKDSPYSLLERNKMKNLKKIYETEKVVYEIEYNGKKVILSPHQLFNQPSFQEAVLSQINEMPFTVKSEEWSNKIQEMLEKGEKYET